MTATATKAASRKRITGRTKVFKVVMSGKGRAKKIVSKKTLVLTPTQLEEEVTTEKKRTRLMAGRIVKVRREGKIYHYFNEENRRASAA